MAPPIGRHKYGGADMETRIDNPWITHSTGVRYENPWIRVEHNEVTTPGGSEGIYGVVRFKNLAVAVVPIDDEDHTWLVGQHRYAFDQYTWEVPAGGCPLGEEPVDTARRELIEETGFEAATITPLFADLQWSNSVTDERAFAFVATDLTQVGARPDETEDLQLRRLPVDEVIRMVLDGEIVDAFSVATYLRLAALRSG